MIEPAAGSEALVTRHSSSGSSRVTLPATDPDVWVHRRGAQPVSRLGATGRLARWSAGDVALVVEVADASFGADTEIKAGVYGRSGFGAYWVVHRAGVELFSEPFESGYRRRASVPEDGTVAVPYRPDVVLAVADLLDAEE